MIRLSKEDVAELKAQAKKEAWKAIDKIYVSALEDPILIPLTWRIWIALGFAVWIFCGIVIYPIACVLDRTWHTVYDVDVMFVVAGLLASGICLFSAIRCMKKPRGRNWNNWLKTCSSSNNSHALTT